MGSLLRHHCLTSCYFRPSCSASRLHLNEATKRSQPYPWLPPCTIGHSKQRQWPRQWTFGGRSAQTPSEGPIRGNGEHPTRSELATHVGDERGNATDDIPVDIVLAEDKIATSAMAPALGTGRIFRLRPVMRIKSILTNWMSKGTRPCQGMSIIKFWTSCPPKIKYPIHSA